VKKYVQFLLADANIKWNLPFNVGNVKGDKSQKEEMQAMLQSQDWKAKLTS